MTIFNKEGKVYILKGPNPLVEKQENWDYSKLVFHNFDWNSIKLINETKIKKDIELKKDLILPVVEDLVKKPVEEKEEEILKDAVPPGFEQKEIVENIDNQKIFDLPYIKYKILTYCLPAFTEKKNDNFYGETWERVNYKTKFVFPMVMINSTDFAIEFWTSDPKEQITKRSIIYPFSYEVHNSETNSYDKVPYDEYRWWKITNKEKKQEGGWLFSAIPSEYQPDFSS